MTFKYEEAFRRNIGWVTEAEQERLRRKKIAIAGLGGVGGIHLLTLARLGFERFHLAEFDRYDLVNFNRQVGANMRTIGQPKLDVMIAQATDINPAVEITSFRQGVTAENVDAFLSGVDLYIDGLDFFAMDTRRLVFSRCAALGIIAMTAGPIGMGAAYITFMPGGMTFEEYFGMEGLPEAHQYVNFLLGLTPSMAHRDYLVDSTRLNLAGRFGPSTMVACDVCAGVAGAEAVKLMLGRGKVYSAPYYQLFDTYHNRYVRGRCIGGAKNPLFRLKAHLGHRQIDRRMKEAAAAPAEATADTPLMRILDMARWTPSADNSQPWRFEIAGDDTVRVAILCDSPPHVASRPKVDEPTMLSAGMMFEALAIAASKEGKAMEWNHLAKEQSGDETVRRFEVRFRDSTVPADRLRPYLPLRCTNRRHYRTAPLPAKQKYALEQSLGTALSLTWRETWKERWQVAAMNARAFLIRMRSRTAYEHLKERLDWEHSFSPDKLPVLSLPMTPLSRRMMRAFMGSWRRMKLLSMLPGGLFPSALETELMPGLRCAAHFVLVRQAPLPVDEKRRIAALIKEGRALMRFWLTLTSFGLSIQPSYSPIVFGHYGLHPSELPPGEERLAWRCHDLAARLKPVLGHSHDRIAFIGRIGVPRDAALASRSMRLPLNALLVADSTDSSQVATVN
ncbi:MAG TPA: ThiF family adenylyltransferase [Pirellulales bacterium]|nr:ThiF family adenylyltransferase [Pirellulales bacterium]